MINFLNTIIYIMVIGNIYLFFGVIMSSLIKKYISKPYRKDKSTTVNFLQLFLETGCIIVSVFFIRRVIIYHLFDMKRLKKLGIIEVHGNVLLAFAFIYFLKDDLHSKINYLYNFFDIKERFIQKIN
jgi:hypothetical protein